MKNMIRHQTKAMTIQVPSTRSSGCFHQTRLGGGANGAHGVSLPGVGAAYLAIGMPTISITPQTM